MNKFAFYLVSGYAARKNIAPPFTATKMMGLLKEGCKNVTGDDWKKVVEKTKNLILHDWVRDIRIDCIIDSQIIIHVSDESDDDDDDDEDDEHV